MKKIALFILGSIFISACVGNPPAWWNPRQTAAPQQTAGKSVAASQPRVQSVSAPISMEAEEFISVPDEGFEEMPLTPLQDEEQENDSGESAAQIMEEENSPLIPSILDE